MKLLFQIIFLFFCLSTFGQKATEIKIAKDKISAAKTIQDIISDIPKDCKVTNFILSLNKDGLKEFTIFGQVLSPETKALIGSLEKGKLFFIENITSGCPKSHKKGYKIIVE